MKTADPEYPVHMLNALVESIPGKPAPEARSRRSSHFTDSQGHLPSVYSLVRLPYVLSTWVETRRKPLLANPSPRMVLDATRFLDKLLRPGMRILELGAGHSTLWLLQKGVNLISYESDPEWAGRILETVRQEPGRFHESRLIMQVLSGSDALEDLKRLPKNYFDIILIDSENAAINRKESLQILSEKIKLRGWIALNNADNPVNQPPAEWLEGKECYRFTGYSPMSFSVSQTAFWRL